MGKGLKLYIQQAWNEVYVLVNEDGETKIVAKDMETFKRKVADFVMNEVANENSINGYQFSTTTQVRLTYIVYYNGEKVSQFVSQKKAFELARAIAKEKGLPEEIPYFFLPDDEFGVAFEEGEIIADVFKKLKQDAKKPIWTEPCVSCGKPVDVMNYTLENAGNDEQDVDTGEVEQDVFTDVICDDCLDKKYLELLG